MATKQGKCIVCGKPTHRKPDPRRPCCNSCEKTAPMAIQAPALFADGGPVAGIARAAMDEVRKQMQ